MSLSTKEGPTKEGPVSLSTKEGPGGFRKEFLSRSFKELSFWSVSVNQGGPRRVPKGVPFKEL